MTNPRTFEALQILSKSSGEAHKLPPLTGEEAIYKGEVVVNHHKTNNSLLGSSAGFFLRVGAAVDEAPQDTLIRVGPAYVTEGLVTDNTPGIEFEGTSSYNETGQIWYRKVDKAFFINDGESWQRLTAISATEVFSGLVRLATEEEVVEGEVTNAAVTPYTLGKWKEEYDFLTRRVEGIQIYVDEISGTDDLQNNGRDPYNPFLSIERALVEVARNSYLPGFGNDVNDVFTINLSGGDYTIDNRPGVSSYTTLPRLALGASGPLLPVTISSAVTAYEPILKRLTIPNASTTSLRRGLELYSSSQGQAVVERVEGNFVFLRRVRGTWSVGDFVSHADYSAFNPPGGGVVVPRGCSIVALDVRKTKLRPLYLGNLGAALSDPNCQGSGRTSFFKLTGGCYLYGLLFTDSRTVRATHHLVSCVEFAYTDDLKDSDYALYKKIYQVFGNTVQPAIDLAQFEAVPAEYVIVAPTENNTAVDESGLLSIDSVESSSPYVYNCSVRSRFGLCGMLIDGSKVSGLRSFVTAQFTNVCLQTDPEAFVIDSNATGGKRYKDAWKHFAFRAVNGGYAQIVSCFVICSAVHYDTVDGGELSITNSCSNFGDISLAAKGYSDQALPQDKGGFIRNVIPPKSIDPTPLVVPVVTFKATGSTTTKIYGNGVIDPERIEPFTLQPGELIYIKGANQLEYAATLAATEPLIQQDSNGWFFSTSATSNAIFANATALADFTIYVKRTPDQRLDDDRIYWLEVSGLNLVGRRRPIENFVLRLDERMNSQLLNVLFAAKVRDKDSSGIQLPLGTYQIAVLSANGQNESLDNLFPELLVDEPLENSTTSLTYQSTSHLLQTIGYTASAVESLLLPGTTPIVLNQDVFVNFHRPSLIRCSGHTWEWQGYLNYSTALPRFQLEVLTLEQSVAKMKQQLYGGRVYSTGMDQDGNYFVGDKVVDLKTGRESVLGKEFNEDQKTFARLTVTEKLLMFAGSVLDIRSAIIAVDTQTQFQTPITADANYLLYATEAAAGFVELATEAEALAGTDLKRVLTAATGQAQVDQLADMLIDMINTVREGVLPGGIVIYSGNLEPYNLTTNPLGLKEKWYVCNGQTVRGRVTPDLRGRFVLGGGLTADIGVTGGASTATLVEANLPPHSHNGTTSSQANHVHSLEVSGDATVTWNNNLFAGGDPGVASDLNGIGDTDTFPVVVTGNTDPAGGHSHTVTTASVGSSTPFSVMPPYYTLAYVMYIP